MAPPRIVGITQARMGSTRLPGKVLLPAAGRSLLDWQLSRLQRCRRLDALLVATSDLAADDALEAHAAMLGVPVFRGSETDVLDRFYRAALAGGAAAGADIVLRFTADCPLIDPALVDALVDHFLARPLDYAGIDVSRYPRGLDAEITRMAVLETAWRAAEADFEREHVMPFIWRRPQLFRLGSLSRDSVVGQDGQPWRWCVDTDADYALVCRLLEMLSATCPAFGWQEADAAMRSHPEWVALNRDVVQKSLPA